MKRIFIYNYFNFAFVKAIAYELKLLGFAVKKLIGELSSKPKFSKNDLVIVLSPYQLNKFYDLNKNEQPEILFWNFDPLNVSRHQQQILKYQPVFRKWVISFVFNHRDFFLSNGCQQFFYIPFGYSNKYQQLFEKYGIQESNEFAKNKLAKLAKNEPIDLLFYGSDLNYKQLHRHHTIQHLRNNGLNVHWVGQNSETYVHGEDLYRLIHQSKIVLSISHGSLDDRTNDLARLALLLSTKHFVIAEKNGDAVIEDKLSKYVVFFSGLDDLVEKCRFYLANPKERKLVANRCYEGFKSDFPLNVFLKNVFSNALFETV